MLLRKEVAHGIADGSVTLVFRRWSKQRVQSGQTLHTSAGVVAIQAVAAVDPAEITEEEAARAGAASAADIRAQLRGTEQDPVFRITVAWHGPDERIALRAEATLSAADIEGLRTRLDRMDARSTHGPWTRATLRVIAEHPGQRAVELAGMLGRERDPFKIDVRKLKNLGLTESLEVGYRISPRGEAFLAADEE